VTWMVPTCKQTKKTMNVTVNMSNSVGNLRKHGSKRNDISPKKRTGKNTELNPQNTDLFTKKCRADCQLQYALYKFHSILNTIYIFPVALFLCFTLLF